MSTDLLNTAASSGITLTSTGADTSPFTISPTGDISTTARYGIYTALSAPELVNEGSVRSAYIDASFRDGGTIINTGTFLAPSFDSIYMRSGGTVINYGSSAELLGEVQIELSPGTVVNEGTIASTEYFGVLLAASGSVANAGKIAGADTGVFLNTSAGAVTNSGTITGAFSGVGLNDGGSVTNSGISSFISGGLTGVIVSNNSGTVTNDGTVIGGTGVGIDLAAGGIILNDGEISGGLYGAGVSGGSGTVVNNGTISSTANEGVKLEGGGTLTNNGVISGGSFAVYLGGTDTNNRLIVGTDAVFNGTVEGAATDSNALELEAGTGALTGIGSQFVGFDAITFDAGASWGLAGELSGFANGQTISGFTFGDEIVLNGIDATVESFVSGTGLVLSDGTSTATLDITGDFVTANFVAQNLGDATEIQFTAPCFCRGTRIATAHGQVPVESLKIGDLVKTATQGFQPVRWIGRRAYDGRFIAGNHMALPVKIRRHALGFNVPSRDLFVSPGHALAEGGVLVHAWRFVNGVSITQAEAVDRVEYFHIELERHAVIFAENAPVESFLDNDCRAQFQNAASAPESLARTPCLPTVEDGFYLARLQMRINSRAGLRPPALNPGPLRSGIVQSGQRLVGWAQDEAAPEVPVELELLCGGQVLLRLLANRYRADLRAAGLGTGCHAFDLVLPALEGAFTVRRAADGAVLGASRDEIAMRRAG